MQSASLAPRPLATLIRDMRLFAIHDELIAGRVIGAKLNALPVAHMAQYRTPTELSEHCFRNSPLAMSGVRPGAKAARAQSAG
jgi:hypothetical protein